MAKKIKKQKAKIKDKRSKKKEQEIKKTAKKISLKTAKKKLQRSKVAKKISKALKTSKSPQTMEELVKTTGYSFHGLKKGQLVEGIITSMSKKAIMVDIGAKTEGIILSRDFAEAYDFVSRLKVGDKIKTIVGMPENDKSQILLSIKQAADNYKWDLFNQYLKTGEEVEVRGLEVNRGGLIARLMGVRGFVPSSQFSRQYLGRLDKLQNKVFKVKVIEVDKQKNRLIFSEKAVSEAVDLNKKKKALSKIKPGDIYSGLVSGVMPFGIFVRVEIKKELMLEGLVHISEISWEKVDNLNNIYHVGDSIKVKVLNVDKNSARLNLSIKQLKDDPWQALAKKYPVDKKVKGKVIKLASFGAFVELEPGVEGLIHISKIPVDLDIQTGKKIDVYIEAIDREKRRMSLGVVLKEKPVGYK